MKLNLAESIRETLFDRQAVSIYGLGTLCLRQEAAEYGEKRQTLLPPTMVLDFEESSSTNTALLDWLRLKYDIGYEEADKALRLFSEKVLNTLLNYGSVYITGVALLERDDENDIICQADESLLNAFYQGYPEVALELPDVEAGAGFISSESNEIKSQELDEKDMDSVIEDLIEGVEEEETDDNMSSSENASFFGETGDSESESMTAKDMHVFDLESNQQRDLPKQTPEEDLPPFSYTEEAEISYRKIWGGILIFVALVIAAFLLYDACNNYKIRKEDSSSSEVPGPADLAEGIAADEASSEMLQGSELQLPVSQDSCIIITGVFASRQNVERMKDKVSSFKYIPYEEVNGAYTRTGLIFECGNVDLENFIRQVRREISPRAWYLQPELYVAYGTE